MRKKMRHRSDQMINKLNIPIYNIHIIYKKKRISIKYANQIQPTWRNKKQTKNIAIVNDIYTENIFYTKSKDKISLCFIFFMLPKLFILCSI